MSKLKRPEPPRNKQWAAIDEMKPTKQHQQQQRRRKRTLQANGAGSHNFVRFSFAMCARPLDHAAMLWLSSNIIVMCPVCLCELSRDQWRRRIRLHAHTPIYCAPRQKRSLTSRIFHSVYYGQRMTGTARLQCRSCFRIVFLYISRKAKK